MSCLFVNIKHAKSALSLFDWNIVVVVLFYYYCKVALHLLIIYKVLQTLKRIEKLTLHVEMASKAREVLVTCGNINNVWKFHKMWKCSVLGTIIYFHEMWKQTATLCYFTIFFVYLNLF